MRNTELIPRRENKYCMYCMATGQWLAGPSSDQEVGGSIPALVDVSLTLYCSL